MKVENLIDVLKKYDPEKEVDFMIENGETFDSALFLDYEKYLVLRLFNQSTPK